MCKYCEGTNIISSIEFTLTEDVKLGAKSILEVQPNYNVYQINTEVYAKDSNENINRVSDEYVLNIEYCPMCGKKLRINLEEEQNG